MKAAVLCGVNDLRVLDIDEPEIQPNEALIEIKACGICGTDLLIVNGKFKAKCPLVLGHQASGRIRRVGENVTNVKPGDRVAIQSWIPCNTCFFCRMGLPHLCDNMKSIGVDLDGAYAEYAAVPSENLYVLPKNVTYDEGALASPLACVVHSVTLAKIKPGDTVAILGSGPIAFLHLQLSKIQGSSRIMMTGRSEDRLAIAKKMGASEVINVTYEDPVDKIKRLTEGRGADAVFEVVGKTETVEQAIKVVRKGGTVIIFGETPKGMKAKLQPYEILHKEIKILGAFNHPFSFDSALKLLETGKVDVNSVISHRVNLLDIQRGFELKARKTGETVLSILVRP